MKAFFEEPPEHDLHVGDLVTCSCHNAVAIIVQLYDDHDAAPMNMAKIWWIIYPHTGIKERDWMHTIDEMRKFSIFKRIGSKPF